MKELLTLIRLHQNELDELRRQLVSLEEQREKLIQLATRIHEELLHEREAAMSQPQMGAYLVDYEKRVKERQTEIAKETVRLDQQIDQLSAAISESFSELKKYEIVRDQRMEAERLKRAKQDQAALDEAGANQFGRQKNKNEGS